MEKEASNCIHSEVLQGEEKWRHHLAKWQESGLSQTDYCRQATISPQYFSKWKVRLQGPEETSRIVPITISGGLPGLMSQSRISILTPKGYRLDINDGVKSEQVHAILKVLERL